MNALLPCNELTNSPTNNN